MAGEQELSTSFNPLDDADYRDSLHHFFEFYNNSQDVFELATWESNGKRPMHLENEIYSAFHHVNRSLFNCKSIDYAKDQIEHAKNSHLMRVQYDSYKIALHAINDVMMQPVEEILFLIYLYNQ